MNNTTISTKFNFSSQYANILGCKLHYIQAGKGDPLLFLHGLPASSYLWRNIIPELSSLGNCIAPDLIGMGQSAKPDIQYRISDHIRYIDEFITELGLRNITFVTHGLGSLIAFSYAERHPENVKGIAFYEAYLGDWANWQQLSLPVQQVRTFLSMKKMDPTTFSANNKLIKKIFDSASLRKLTPEELAIYNAPFSRPADRKLLWYSIEESPFGNDNPKLVKLINKLTASLEKSPIPKLMLYTVPGFLTPISLVHWCRDHLQNLTLVDLGEGLHFVQEYNPEGFAQAVGAWYQNKIKKN